MPASVRFYGISNFDRRVFGKIFISQLWKKIPTKKADFFDLVPTKSHKYVNTSNLHLTNDQLMPKQTQII
jgi:hypothetical protein